MMSCVVCIFSVCSWEIVQRWFIVCCW